MHFVSCYLKLDTELHKKVQKAGLPTSWLSKKINSWSTYLPERVCASNKKENTHLPPIFTTILYTNHETTWQKNILASCPDVDPLAVEPSPMGKSNDRSSAEHSCTQTRWDRVFVFWREWAGWDRLKPHILSFPSPATVNCLASW